MNNTIAILQAQALAESAKADILEQHAEACPNIPEIQRMAQASREKNMFLINRAQEEISKEERQRRLARERGQ